MSNAVASADILAMLPLAAKKLAIERAAEHRITLRESQLPPAGPWAIWLILAGRGWGKTLTGASWVNVKARSIPRIALVAASAADYRDLMVEGDSGILATADPMFRPVWRPSLRRVEWPNGARAYCYSGEDPESLRGPNMGAAWCDELAAWRHPRATWDMLMFTMRKGVNPQTVITTTPKPSHPTLKHILKLPMLEVTRGSSMENRANLSAQYFDLNIAPYLGTRLGRQEIEGEILEDVEGALWSYAMIDAGRVGEAPDMDRVVVGVDPSGGAGAGHDEAGIVVAGRLGRADALAHYYTLADYSLNASPDAVARAIVDAWRAHSANRIVAEGNYGGEMVRALIRNVSSEAARQVEVVHARQGKSARAQPIAGIYEQGRGHHVGSFKRLEDELTTWVEGEESPNRLDALVWAYTSLAKPTKRMGAA